MTERARAAAQAAREIDPTDRLLLDMDMAEPTVNIYVQGCTDRSHHKALADAMLSALRDQQARR